MIGRKPTIISIADEKRIAFLMLSKDGRLERRASLSMDDIPAEGHLVDALPKWVRQVTHQLLVVPDYWIGNDSFEFQARKQSIVAAFIERKLKVVQPNLRDAVDFYDYTFVQDQDHRQMLCCIYLQEAMAYELYRRLEELNISPHLISSPALIWQSWLNRHIDGFADCGIGFVHLMESDCFLYFYNMGQFLFSRHIQLPETEHGSPEIYNLLNYEINQSFYLYSQKSKRSVDSLIMLAEDPEATGKLSELLGREVQEMPPSLPGAVLIDETENFAVCRGFSTLDLKNHSQPGISYKPLRREMAWRPVQWAGVAIGIILIILLAMEAGYLNFFQKNIQQQQSAILASSSTQQPEQVLNDLTQILNEIISELGRPSGSGVMMRTLLAMPATVSLQKIILDTVDVPRLTVEALVDANHPDTFKTILVEFLNRLNQRFNLEDRPLREKDVRIRLERKETNDRQPLYQIHFNFELI